tara:strand:+ start:273 stop:608 length:336 start_codon:yes stop_codon:yes gene_type:complete
MIKRTIMFDFATAEDLYSAYMPFVTNGGVFIPTSEKFELCEEVILDLRLIKDAERQVCTGAVAWITPAGAQGGKPAGIGIQFNYEDSSILRTRIETHLSGKLNSSHVTHTM